MEGGDVYQHPNTADDCISLKAYLSSFLVMIIQTNTLAGLEFSLFTKHILPNVVQGVLLKASSLVHVTFDSSDDKFSGGDFPIFAKLMSLRNSGIKVKIEIVTTVAYFFVMRI